MDTNITITKLQNDKALAAIALAGGGTPKEPKPHGAVGLCNIPLAPVGLNWDELMANLYAIHRERMGRGTSDPVVPREIYVNPDGSWRTDLPIIEDANPAAL